MKKSILALSLLCIALRSYANEPMIIMHDDLSQVFTPSKVPELKIDKNDTRVETLKIDAKKDTSMVEESSKKRHSKTTQKYASVKEKTPPKIKEVVSVVNLKTDGAQTKPLTSVPRKDWGIVDGKKVEIKNLSAQPKPLVVSKKDVLLTKKEEVTDKVIKDKPMMATPMKEIKSSWFDISVLIYSGIALLLAGLCGLFMWFKLNKNEEDINYF